MKTSDLLILNEMMEEDVQKGVTSFDSCTVAMCPDFLGGSKVKGGYQLSYGVPAEVGLDMVFQSGRFQGVLYLFDKYEFFKRKEAYQKMPEPAATEPPTSVSVDVSKMSLSQMQAFQQVLNMIGQEKASLELSGIIQKAIEDSLPGLKDH